MALEAADARIEIGVLILVALPRLVERVLELFDLALQRLHLRLQRLVLVDQIDGAVALPVRLLFEALDALGQGQALLRADGSCEHDNGGHEGRRCDRTRLQVRHFSYFAV